ncbi:MAG: hypothetical protein ACOC44_16115 [Promethearchaeia archaeon]
MERKYIIIIHSILLTIHIFGIFTSIILGDIAYDFGIYYRDVQGFWFSDDPYGEIEFYYLYYFYFLYAWIAFLDVLVALLIHIAFTHLTLYYVLKKIDLNDSNEKLWFITNLPLFFWFSITFNVNSIILFALLFYQVNKGKWYAPLSLLLAFYKATSILAFGFLFLINLIYDEKKIKAKELPMLGMVFGIVAISLLIGLENIVTNVATSKGFDVALQATHLIWVSYPFLILVKNLDFNEKQIRWVWTSYVVFWVIFCAVMLVVEESIMITMKSYVNQVLKFFGNLF